MKTIILFLFIVQVVLITGCFFNKQVSEGEKLANMYCGSCHQFPEPELLDKGTWSTRVLPRMALRLGFLPAEQNIGNLQDDYYQLTDNQLLPSRPLVSELEWQKIRNYYLDLAPDTLRSIKKPAGKLKLFTAKKPDVKTGQMPAVTTIGHFEHHGTLATSFASKKLWISEVNYAPYSIDLIPKLVSHIEETGQDNLLVTFLGDVIRPDAPASGIIAEFNIQNRELKQAVPLPLPPLNRPVQAFHTELDENPGQELVVLQFGFLRGSLGYWYEDEKGKWQETLIANEPGALQAVADDFNQDGRTDLMVLFAHGNERISIFFNQGNGNFKENTILTFPPVYGSSSFLLADLDQDGRKDIVYTCGDNADLSPVPKPYHGIYLYKNLGKNQYRQMYHYPLHGAYRAVAEDFDQDGDLDLAAVGFFTDLADPQGFVYLNQTAAYQFQPLTLDLDRYGRWIDLAAADYDGDGDLDILLGNGYGLTGLDFVENIDLKEAPPWLVLENQTIVKAILTGNKNFLEYAN